MVNSGDHSFSLFRVANYTGAFSTPEEGLLVYGPEGAQLIVQIIQHPWLNVGLNLFKCWEPGARRSIWRASPFVVLLGYSHGVGVSRKHSPASASLVDHSHFILLPLFDSTTLPLFFLNSMISSRTIYFHKTKILHNEATTQRRR